MLLFYTRIFQSSLCFDYDNPSLQSARSSESLLLFRLMNVPIRKRGTRCSHWQEKTAGIRNVRHDADCNCMSCAQPVT